MQKLTPNWKDLSEILMFKLDEVADGINWKLECGEDPATTVNDAVADLKLFIGAIEDDPGQFSIKDVS